MSKIEDGCLPELPKYLKPLIEQSTETLSGTELTKLTLLLYKYQDIFKSPDGQLGRTNIVKHRIDTGNAVPIKQRPRRLPVSQIEAVDKELDKMEAEGIIEAIGSPWSSPLVIVTKKNGDLRVCVDYRAVNEVMSKSAVPLPKSRNAWILYLDLNIFVQWTLPKGIIKLQCTQMTNVRLHSPQEEG